MADRLLDELVWRGLLHDVTDPALGDILQREQFTLYAGFDPTADSLHVGHLLGILGLMRFQQAGHRPIALAGGGTGLIGDPSGRDSERALLSVEEVKSNVEAIRLQLERFIDFGAERNPALLIDNYDWLGPLQLLEFLRDVGKRVTVATMLAKESVRARMEGREEGISFAEFTYMLLQAHDFLQLHDAHDCRLQIGGSDQWGNISLGADVIRRMRGSTVHGLTWPLITLPGGEKMGKSTGHAVWLDERRTSPYQLYQFFFRAEDSLVGHYLRAFTFLPRERITELDDATSSRPEAREAQRSLASEVTTLVHSESAAAIAKRVSEVLFTEEIATLDETTLLDVMTDAPSTTRPRNELDGEGLLLVDALASSGLAASRSAARRLIEQGGAYVNNRREQAGDRRLIPADLLAGGHLLLRKGAQDQHLVRFA